MKPDEKLTVKDLRDKLDEYIKTGFEYGLKDLQKHESDGDYLSKKIDRENTEVLLADDGMQTAFFKPEVTCATKFEKEISPGKYEKPRKVFILTFDKFREYR